MRLTQIFAAAAIALVSTFAVADDAANKAIRQSLEKLELEVPVESINASPLRCQPHQASSNSVSRPAAPTQYPIEFMLPPSALATWPQVAHAQAS